MYRQGDVLIVSCDTIPKTAKELKTADAKILAYSESTGHKHQIVSDNVVVLTDEDRKYLSLISDCELKHEKHGVINLPKRNYQVIIQRQYTPKGVQNVRD